MNPKKSQYYMSLGYTNQDGIVRKNNLERYTIKADLNQNASDWMKIGLGVQASNTNIKGVSSGNINISGMRMLPNVAIYNIDDPTGYNIEATNRQALGKGSNKKYIDNGFENIIWSLDNNENKSSSYRMIGNAYAELSLMKGFSFKTQAGLDISNQKDYKYYDASSGMGYGYQGLIESTSGITKNWNWQNVLSYNKTFAKRHNLDVTLVQEYTYSEYKSVFASVDHLSDSYFKDDLISNTYTEKNAGGYKTYYGIASYLGRINYNYDSKYYFGLSIRRDGLSKLHKDSRWGTFWGASAAWKISKESFWKKNSNIFSDMRLRVSYATLGNSELPYNYIFLSTCPARKYGSQTGLGWNNTGNRTLKWETTETFDLGIDGTLMGGKINYEIAYWQKNSKDLILDVPVPPSFGIPYANYWDNYGKVDNSGIELTIGSDIIRDKNFTWHADLNFSTLRNNVRALYGNMDNIDNYSIVREGESYKSIYGYDYYGVNKENGNPIWKKTDGSLVQFDAFGDHGYKVYDKSNPSDVSRPSSLEETDRKILGTSIPTWYGGLTNTINYKNFDVNIFFRFSGGNKIMNASRQSNLFNMDFANNGKDILGRWQSKEIPGDGKTPRIGYADNAALFNDGFSDSHFVEDGAYLKLANLALGYTIPKNILYVVGFSKARIYVQAQNLFTVTGYSGLDPEINSNAGIDLGGLPQQRVFTFGANVTF